MLNSYILHSIFKEQSTSVTLFSVSDIYPSDNSIESESKIKKDEGELTSEKNELETDCLSPDGFDFESYDARQKKNESGINYFNFDMLSLTFGYKTRTVEFDLFKMKFGLNVFDTDRLISLEKWKTSRTKFFVPVYFELNPVSVMFDKEFYFWNPEVSFGIDLNLIAAGDLFFGVEAKHKFSIRNIIKKIVDGNESIEKGLRGNLGTGRVNVSFYFRKTL